ncbi:MAG TPA: DUF5666 domain-containing protein, partial [Sulfuricaulis sp.]|nr:DUF5666 domain-containing protein [Sulfuricaulis sp.]
EGFITESNPGGFSFRIGNQQVAWTGSTLFLPQDFSAADLVVGAKLEAEGTLANGVLTASKISFRENVKLESDVASGNNSSFTLAGLPGISVTTNSATDFRVAVVQNAQVRVRGIEGPNNTVLATRIEDRGSSSNAFLQGPVDTKVGTVITILGISVNTNQIPDNFPSPDPNFQDVNEQGVTRATFLGLVQPGTLVKFKGDLQGQTILWDEAELED